MPWKIFKDNNQFCLHKETPDGGKGERVACHDSEEKAQAQMRALYASENKAVDYEQEAQRIKEAFYVRYPYPKPEIQPVDPAPFSITAVTDSWVVVYEYVPDGYSGEWIVPYTIGENGAVLFADRSEWKHARQEWMVSKTWVTDTTADVPCEDCDDDSAKAGKRLNSAMLTAARDALVTLAKLVKWAGYEDEEKENEESPEDEAEDEAEEKSTTFAVKALTPDRIGGYAVLWGGPDKLDVTGEYFARDTAELDSIFKAVGKLPQLYHHGGDGTLKSDVIGCVDTLKFDDVGVWFEAQLTAANRYKDAVMGLVNRGALGVSSGTLPRARKVASDGKIMRWPIAEISLTPSPAEPRMLERPVAAIKAAYVELGLEFPMDAESDKGVEDTRREADLELERIRLLEISTR